MNKKISFPIAIIIIAVLAVLVGASGIYWVPFLYREYQIIKWPDYYKNLARKCPVNVLVNISLLHLRPNCCLDSVSTMIKYNFEVIPETGCPDGYEGMCAMCQNSYCFCASKEKIKDLLEFPVYHKK